MAETHSLLCISILLTEKGHLEVKEVLDAVFRYLKMLQLKGPNQRIFEEYKKIMELEFEFEEEGDSIDDVENLSTIMQDYPSEQYLSWWLFKDFNFTLIENILNNLTSGGVNIFLSSKEYKDIASKIEPIYQTRYTDEDIPEEWRLSWANTTPILEFKLPEPNIFIAESLKLLPEICSPEQYSKYPIKIKSESSGELYYRQDLIFKQPRAITAFKLCSAKSIKSPEERIYRCILDDMINHMILEDEYPAIQALLGTSISLSSDGSMTIGVNGLNENLMVLMELLVSFLSQTDWPIQLDERLFETLLDQLKKDFFNGIIDPSFLAGDLHLAILQKTYPTNLELLEAIKKVNYAYFWKFSLEFLNSFVYIKGLVQGNMAKDEAIAMFEMVRDNLIKKNNDGFCGKNLEEEFNKIGKGEMFLRVNGINRNDSNTVVKLYYQSDAAYTLKELVPLQIGLEFMEEPLFNVLRTQEQLGYSVHANLVNTGGILGTCITVKSPAHKFTPEHIHDRIEAFIDWFIEDKLLNLSDDEFQKMISTMIKKVKTKDVNLGEEFDRNWNRIISRDYLFDVMVEDAKLLASCSKTDVYKSISSVVKCGPDRKKLSIQVVGHKDATDGQELEEIEQQDVTLNADANIELEYSDPTCNSSLDSENYIKDINKFRNNLESFPNTQLSK